jgi:hypothetical protein
MAERKYQMTKIDAGDYVLLSNSQKSLWRFQRYEDGPSHGLQDWKADRQVWSCARYCHQGRSLPNGSDDMYDVLNDRERWVTVADTLTTRQQAIDCALECAKRRGI